VSKEFHDMFAIRNLLLSKNSAVDLAKVMGQVAKDVVSRMTAEKPHVV